MPKRTTRRGLAWTWEPWEHNVIEGVNRIVNMKGDRQACGVVIS